MKYNSKSEEEKLAALQPVLRFIEESTDELYGLTSMKIRNRAGLVEDDRFPGSVVFELERHPEILGLPGSEDSPNASRVYQTMRYRYDPETNTLDELGQIGDSKVVCNIRSIAESYMEDLSFECVRRQDDTVLCKEIYSNEEKVVNSAEEAEDFGRSVVESKCLDHAFDGVEGPLTTEQIASLFSDFKVACHDVGAEGARMAWEEQEEEE